MYHWRSLVRIYPSWAVEGYRYVKLARAYLRHKFTKTYYRVWNPWFLKKNQWRTEDEIKELQLEGLKQIVEYARNNVIYYKNLPEIKKIEDLENIPLLTKDLIHKNFDRLRASVVPGHIVRTSGTVSTSTIFKDNRLKADWGEERFHSWFNVPRRRLCQLWGIIDIPEEPLVSGDRLLLPVDPLNTREDAVKYLKMIDEFKPNRIQAYASAMRFLAHFALQEGISPDVGVIYTTAEMLSPEARKDIEEAFQCEVFNFYGSRELGSMAQDCEIHQDLHLNAERYITEEVNGRLLFTDLLNYSMPLIRYENQDLGELSSSKCSCGRGLPLMKPLEGRIFDFLYTKSGKWVTPVTNDLLDEGELFRWLSGYQFIQEERGKITLSLRPWSRGEKIPSMNLIKKSIQELWPKEEIEVDVKIVDSLKLSPSGKQIYVITKFRPWEE